MSPQPTFWSNPTYLRTEQYRTDENLADRQRIHELFSTNPQNWMVWVLGMGRVEARQKLLDVGCGNGRLWSQNFSTEHPAHLDVTLLDLSRKMVEIAAQSIAGRVTHWRGIEGDAMALPFPTDYFDRIFANHMLYHVPSPAKAIAEIWRTLRPRGRMVAALNGEAHMRELWSLVGDLLGIPLAPTSSTVAFGPVAATSLFRVHFRRVTKHPFDDSLRVTDADLLWKYVASTDALREVLHSSVDLHAVEEQFKTVVNRAIQKDGYFFIQKDVVAFVCEK